MDLRKQPSWKTPTIASLVLYGICILPVIGEVSIYLLLPVIAGLLLTTGMVLLAIETVIGTQPVRMMLWPVLYVAAIATIYIDGRVQANAATAQVAQSVEEARSLRLYGSVRSLTLVQRSDDTVINPHRMLAVYLLDEVTQIDPETRKGYRYTVVPGDKAPKLESGANAAETARYSRTKDENGNVALIKRVPASSYSRGPVIIEGKTQKVPGFKNSEMVPLEIRSGGQSVTLLSAWAETPAAYPLPMLYRDPWRNRGIVFYQGFEQCERLDPDGMEAMERVVELLDLKPQDLSRFSAHNFG